MERERERERGRGWRLVGSQRKRVILDFYATPVQNSTILEARLCNTLLMSGGL